MGRATAILVKRVAPLAVVLAMLGLAFVLLAPKLVSIEVVRRSMSREIAGWSGRSMTFEGTPQVAFTPYLTVTFPKVRISSARDETTLVEMDQLRAQVPILPLFFRGRIEPSSFSFLRPRFHLAVDAAGVPNWDVPSALDASSPLRQLIVTGGSIDYRDGAGRALTVENIDAVLDLPDPQKLASVQGRASWQGKMVSFYASLNSIRALFDGKAADVRFAIESEPLRASFDGSLRRLDGLAANGQLSLSTPSLTGLAELFAIPTGRLPRFGDASISSTADFVRGTLTLGDAALTVDGNQGVGALSLALGAARPSIQATLAFDLLDITNYARAVRSVLGASRIAPDEPLGWPRLDGFNADLRLSADQLRLGGETAGRMAASLAVRDGRLDVAIGDLQLYGGRLTASLSAETLATAPSASLQARIDQLPLKAALSDLAGISAIDGTAGGTLSLQGRGASWNELVASLVGRGSVSIASGTIGGISLDVLSRSTAAPQSLEPRLFNGKTSFSNAKGDITVAGGVVSAPNIAITGTDYTIDMAAEARIGAPEIRAHGEATIAGQRAPALALPFDIGGTWLHPVVTPVLPAAATP
ncbi:MAG TPA: AsmA family protein [Kaistia sp.]|nr:AsmA family protein [Kaistia sp.]